MQTLKILVVGAFNSGRTSFIRSLSEIDVVAAEKSLPLTLGGTSQQRLIALDFGRLTLSDELVLYFLGAVGNSSVTTLLDVFSQNPSFTIFDGLVMMIRSQSSEFETDIEHILARIQTFNCPYVVALSRQDLPNARTPPHIRAIFSIPDDIKILIYDWQDPKTTKRVVLELLGLMPRDMLVQQAIDGLRAQIEGE